MYALRIQIGRVSFIRDFKHPSSNFLACSAIFLAHTTVTFLTSSPISVETHQTLGNRTAAETSRMSTLR